MIDNRQIRVSNHGDYHTGFGRFEAFSWGASWPFDLDELPQIWESIDEVGPDWLKEQNRHTDDLEVAFVDWHDPELDVTAEAYLAQLQRDRETKIGAVLADPFALALLFSLEDGRRTPLAKLTSLEGHETELLAFAKLLRADLIAEVDSTNVLLTPLGKRQSEQWRRLLTQT